MSSGFPEQEIGDEERKAEEQIIIISEGRRVPIRRKYEDAFQNGRRSSTAGEKDDDEDIDDSLEEHIVPQPTTQLNDDHDLTRPMAAVTSSVEGVKAEAAPIVKVIPCGVHTCFQTFTTLQEYSNHYNRRHMYVCGTCKKSLPTSHILELHVLELHDTYFAMSVPKKPMFSCFLETCKEKFQDVQSRKSHCLQEHKFPEKFQYWEFRKPEKKSGKSNSKSKRKVAVDEVPKRGNKQIQQPTTKPGSQDKEKDPAKIESDSSGPIAVTKNGSPEEVVMAEEGSEEGHKKDSTPRTENPAKGPQTRNGSSGFVQNSVRAKHLTFGRSAPRVFKSNYSFGLPKNSTPNVNETNNASASPSEDQMDLTEVQKALVKLL